MKQFRGIQSVVATALGAGVVMALLSGCTAAQAESPQTEAPSSAPSTAPTVAPSEETADPEPEEPAPPAAPVIDLENPGSWLIGFDGIGPVVRGAQIADIRQSLGAYVEDEIPEWCPVTRFVRDGAPDLWATLGEDFTTITGVFVGGGANPADVAPGSPRTAEGIGVGSSLDEMLAAYPAITKSGEFGGGTPTLYHAAQGPDAVWLVFASSDDVVTGVFIRDTPRPPSEYCG